MNGLSYEQGWRLQSGGLDTGPVCGGPFDPDPDPVPLSWSSNICPLEGLLGMGTNSFVPLSAGSPSPVIVSLPQG